MRISILTFFILIGSLELFSQTVNPVLWQRRIGPVGGAIYDIEYDASTGLYYAIVGDNRRLFFSQDDGANWEEYTSSPNSFNYFNDIEITNNTIYLTTSYSIWSSPAVNQEWSEITSNFGAFSNANKIKRLSTGRLVVLANAGIFYSTNQGTSWTQVSLTGSLNGSYLINTSADQLFIIKDQKPFRSNDLGASFTEFSTGLPVGFQAHSIWANNAGTAIYCVTGDNIYISDGTSGWTSIKGGSISDATISSFSTEVSLLEFSADGLGMFFIDNVNHKLHAKAVGGAASTWALRQSSFPSATSTISNATSKEFPTAATSTVFFGTKTGVIKTTNGATTYADANTNLSGLDPSHIIADMNGGGNGSLLMVANNETSILKSTNLGDTWSKVTGFTGSVYNIAQNTSRNTIYMVTSTGGFRSNDGGNNWTTITLPGPLNPQRLIPADDNKVFGIYASTLYYSSNQGANWVTPAITGLPAGSGYALSDNLTMCANANRMILRLYDYNTSTYKLYKVIFAYNGSNAITSAVATQITNLPFVAEDINKMFAFKGNFYVYNPYTSPDQIAVSTDAGVTWNNYSVQTGNELFVATNGYIFYPGNSGSSSQLFISRDNGATFQETTFDGETQPYTYNITGVAIDYNGNGVLALNNDFVYRTKKTIELPDALPSGLVEVGKSATAVSLRWDDNVTNETGFEIFQSTNGVDYVKIGEAEDFCNTPNDRDFFVATNLAANTAYTFRVRAKNDAGTTTPVQIGVTTANACTQTIPDNRSWSAVNTGTSGFAIVSPPKTVSIRHMGGGKYQISDMSLLLLGGSADPGVFYESCGQTFVAESDDTKSDGNGTWNGTNALTLKWRACNSDEFETINLTLNATDPVPATPIVRAYNLSNNSIEVNWNIGDYQKTYIVERSTNAISGFVEVGTVDYPNKKFINNTGLVAGTQYFYRVKARNGNTPTPLESPYSGNAAVTFNVPKFVVPNNTITNYVAVTVGSYWADFDNDGFDDYFTISFDPVTEKGTPIVFKNTGTGDFTQTPLVGVVSGESYFTSTLIDFDNDGKLDLAFSGQEDGVFDVYKGNGDFSFNRITSSLGALATLISEDMEIASMTWGDIDNDGLLDLIVLGNLQNGNTGRILLYHQNANHTFTKIDGGDEMGADTGGTTAASWADYDNDGYQDVLIINQEGAFRLYRNNGDLTFEKKTGIGLSATDALTAVWGDYNNDGNMDLYVGTPTLNLLFRNNGNGTFSSDNTTSISEPSNNISSVWGDFNNDGFLDLYTASFLTGQSRMFLRDASSPGTITFIKHISEKINDVSISHYGVSTSDYDLDGHLDVALSSFEFTETSDGVSGVNTNLFKNNTATGNWSVIKLNPTSGNESGVGATVKITAGGVTQTRQIQSATTFVSKSSTTTHFGIGAASTITNIQVKWANGDVQNYPNPPKNQVLTIDQDNVAPSIVGFSPANNATNVSTNTTFSVTLNEECFAVGGKMLLLYLSSNLSSPILGINVTDAVKSGNTFTFTLPSNLSANTQYNISIDAGAFVDKYANASEEAATGNWKFTTASGPVATLLSPVTTSTDIAANTGIQITFDKNVTAVSGKRLKIMDGTTAVVDIDVAATGTVVTNVYQFTPSSKLPTGKTLKVVVDPGAFKDATTQADFPGIAADAWIFTIAPGPVVTSVSPANNATNVTTNTALQITFDKNVTAVSGKKLKVMDGATTVVDVDVSTTGTVTNNVYSVTPLTALPTDKVLKVVVDADAFIDPIKQTNFAGIAIDSWNFRTALAPDVTAPAITFIPPLTAPKGFNNLVSPEITVTDDRGTVSSVVITIKKISGTVASAVNVPAIQGTGANINKWVFSISEANHFDAIGAEYFIVATDPAGNEARNPATGTHKIFLTYGGNESKIPSDKMGFGGAATNWKVFSIPFEMAPNNSVTAIFNELDGKQNKIDYRFLTIQSPGNTNWTEYPSFTTINRGQGYFSNIKTPVDILLGAQQAPENSRTNLFTINLKAGWNMVGNPYLTQISWADVKTYNALTGQMAELHKFNGSTYPVGVQTLDAYEGGFVFSQSDKAVTIPFLGQVASGGREGYHLLDSDINATEWLLHLNVKQADVINDLGGIGMTPDAKLSLDDYDGVTPPRFIQFLETNFAHPEHFAKRFTRDVVPTQNEYTWSFTVDTNLEGEAEIFWDNSAFINGAKEMFLYDENRQRLVDMRAVNRYSFNPKESVNFKVYFGENLRIAPESVLLGKAFPNPTSGTTSIAFSLPDSGGQNQFVTLDILDATGRTMGTIAQGRYQPGFYEADFNAKELNNGFYTYRLTVQNSRGRNTLVNKLIIK